MEIVKLKKEAILRVAMKDSSIRFYFAARILPLVAKFATKMRQAYIRAREQRKVHAVSLSKQKFFSLNKADIFVLSFNLGYRKTSRKPPRPMPVQKRLDETRR